MSHNVKMLVRLQESLGQRLMFGCEFGFRVSNFAGPGAGAQKGAKKTLELMYVDAISVTVLRATGRQNASAM